MAGQLDGKVAVITGGTAGIGLATARRFVAEGAYVFITGRRPDVLDTAVREIGQNVTGVTGDASVPGDLDRLYAAVARRGRGIDVLVANAGGGGGSAGIEEMTQERFDAAAGLTFRGTYFTVQRALPLLTDGATIVLVASIAASNGTAGHGVYNASKAAVRSLARTLTVELKGRGIRVNAVSQARPTPTASPASRASAVMSSGGTWPRSSRSAGSAVPRRWRAPRCSWPPRRAASSPASSWWWTAG